MPGTIEQRLLALEDLMRQVYSEVFPDTGPPPPPPPPNDPGIINVALTVTPAFGVIPFTLTADASASSGSLPLRTYGFDWGDGTSTGVSTSPTSTHTYPNAGTYTVTVFVTNSVGTVAQLARVVTANPPPAEGGVDLIVTALAAAPESPVAGDAVSFSVTIKNNGTDAVPAGTTIGTGIYLDGAVPPAAPITFCNHNSGLAGGATAVITTTTGLWPGGPWTATAGAHTITAWVDDTNAITEVQNTNNTMAIGVTVTVPPAASVVIDRGSVNAITAGTTLDSDSFTPAANSLLVVVTEGTTI